MSVKLAETLRDASRRAGLGSVSPIALGGVALVAGVIVLVAVARWLPGDSGFAVESGVGNQSAEADVGPGTAEGPGASVPSAEPTAVVVHVVGAVRHPGIVTLPSGSRVAGAIQAAGGFLSNAAQQSLNLAGIVTDGEQIVVLTADEWAAGTPPPAAGAVAGAATAGPGASGRTQVDINSASAEQLEALPGVGPSTAAKIVQDRETNGPFDSAEDLMRVSGIGPKKFEALKDSVLVR